MSLEEGFQEFPATHWSLVRRAGWEQGEARRAALDVLLRRYLPALRTYLRVVRRMPADQAEDLLQGFVADRLLAGRLLQLADQRRGRFRSLLLTSLNHFAASRRRGREAGVALPEGLAGPDAEAAIEVEAAWARELVRQVTEAMREQCVRTGRMDIWGVFEGRVLAEALQERPLAYEALAERYGLRSPAQAANLLVTAKRMYARLMRSAVGEYERDEAEVDEEIRDLRRILAGG
jgi:RNA polymerase sigma-70 factor (ECF subfamily)